MPIDQIQENDIGTVFEYTIKDNANAIVDLSTASTGVKNLLFTRPDDVALTRTLTFYTDGTDGIVRYTSVNGDLIPAGIWQARCYFELANGKWHTDIDRFRVHKV